MHEWIKLHRSLRNSEVYQDPAAKVVFIHLLLISDEHGKGRVGRFNSAIELRMKPSTFYTALQRCVSNYKLLQLESNSKVTAFSILNWDKYQSIGNSKVTENQQQNNSVSTLYKEKIEIKKKKYSSLKDLSQKEFEEIAQEYSISVTTVSKKYSDLVNYCQSKGKTYKNYLATLKAWISKDLETGKLHKVVVFSPPTLPVLSADEQEKVRTLITEARLKIGKSA